MATHVLHQSPLHSNAVNQLSMAAENFLHRLMNAADRYGCYHAHIAMLRAFLYPLKVDDVKPEHISAWLAECINAGLIKLYEVNSEQYLQIQGFKCRSGAIKTIIPEPFFEEETQEPGTTETSTDENTVQGTPEYSPTPPVTQNTPEPGKEHEFYLQELFKRENEKHLNRLAVIARVPEVKRSWVKAFNAHIRDEGRKYKVDNEWLERLRVWLPLNIQRLIQEETKAANRSVRRNHAPLVM